MGRQAAPAMDAGGRNMEPASRKAPLNRVGRARNLMICPFLSHPFNLADSSRSFFLSLLGPDSPAFDSCPCWTAIPPPTPASTTRTDRYLKQQLDVYDVTYEGFGLVVD